jgi:hypothetical protein
VFDVPFTSPSFQTGIKLKMLDNLRVRLNASGLSAWDLKVNLPKALQAIQLSPVLLQNFPIDLAQMLNIPEPIANIALAAFQDHGKGVVTIDPDVTRRFLPEMKASNAALLIANSQYRPVGSGIQSPSAMQSRLSSFTADNAATLQQMKESGLAQDAIDRARRTLDRQNWVEWYRRIEDADLMP